MVLGSKPTKAELGQASGLRDKNRTNLYLIISLLCMW